jgi:hypothetical protein
MNSSLTNEQMISGYFEATIDAVRTLYEKKLYGHCLLVIYSTIDTLGLLDAPPITTQASQETFKSWTKKYLLCDPDMEFNDVDLWAARCSLLHTFTPKSLLSNKGKAREFVYYSGDKDCTEALRLKEFSKSYQGGRHLLVNYEALMLIFFEALSKFVPVLEKNCLLVAEYKARLRNIYQLHSNIHTL